MYRWGLNLSGLVALCGIVLFISLHGEIKAFFLESIEKRSNLLILCILFFSGLGIILNFDNLVQIGFFIILFFSFYLIFEGEDNILKNVIFNLVIFSGFLISVGVYIGLTESIFFSSKLFYFTIDGYAYFDEKPAYSGFGFNHNYCANIIVIAQSFLFLSTSFTKRQKMYLSVFFLAALITTTAKIAFLFFALLIINFFFKQKITKIILIFGLVCSYLFLAHTVIAPSDSYEIGSIHYQQLLFSFFGFDFILGAYGYLKEVYFIALTENFFLPISLGDLTQALGYEPHFLFFSLIILGGFPLCLSFYVFIIHRIYKRLKFFKTKLPIYFFCGFIATITESFLWDAYDSAFFWIIIVYALTFSKDHSIPEEGSKIITQ